MAENISRQTRPDIPDGDQRAARIWSQGAYIENLAVGDRFRSQGRTLTEADLASFVNLSWMTEEVFTNHALDDPGAALTGKVVPAAMLLAFAEGLARPLLENTGLALLEAGLKLHAPGRVGDTIHVETEVLEARATSKPGRGIFRAMSAVKNQNNETLLAYTPVRMLKTREAPRD